MWRIFHSFFVNMLDNSRNANKHIFLNRILNTNFQSSKTFQKTNLIIKKIVIFNNNESVFWLKLLINSQNRVCFKSRKCSRNDIEPWFCEMYKNAKPCTVMKMVHIFIKNAYPLTVMILENKYIIIFVDLVIFKKGSQYNS